MTRTRAEVIAAMADAARLATYDGDLSWRDALFRAGPDGHDLSRPTDPDRVLLAALADEVNQVDAHAATLPSRLHVAWLERCSGCRGCPWCPTAWSPG